jgi:hypothetical protein
MPQELHDYLNVRTESSIIVDRSVDGDLLRINFNFRYVAEDSRWTHFLLRVVPLARGGVWAGWALSL